MVRSHPCLLGVSLALLIAAPACDDDENPSRPVNRDTRLEWPVDGAHPVSDAPRADRIDEHPRTDAHGGEADAHADDMKGHDAAAPHPGGDAHPADAGSHDHPGDAHGGGDSPVHEGGSDAASDPYHEDTADAPPAPEVEDGGDADAADGG